MSAWGRSGGSLAFGPMRGRWIAVVLLALALLHVLRSAWGDALDAAPSKPERATCNRATFRVAVDVGHTVQAPGALSARGVSEYEFNLRLAKGIEQKLVESGFPNTVLLITSGPAKRSLTERVERASALHADLFLSVHHDSVPGSFKEEWEHEGRKNSYSDRFKGHSIFVSYENRQLKASLDFAKLLGRELKAQGLEYTPHYSKPFMGRWQKQLIDAETGVYRYDELVVLRTTRMPAVLFEAGSIVNREEELLLASPTRQQPIAAAVAEAVEAYCGDGQPKRAPSVTNAGSAHAW
jgi:N-acetylmuramoyl-L-alanine amidase